MLENMTAEEDEKKQSVENVRKKTWKVRKEEMTNRSK
jgi:hypothetical protein